MSMTKAKPQKSHKSTAVKKLDYGQGYDYGYDQDYDQDYDQGQGYDQDQDQDQDYGQGYDQDQDYGQGYDQDQDQDQDQGYDQCNYQQGNQGGQGYQDQNYQGPTEPADCYWGEEGNIIYDEEPNALANCVITADDECWQCAPGYTYDTSDWTCMSLAEADCTDVDFCSQCIGDKKATRKGAKGKQATVKRLQKRTGLKGKKSAKKATRKTKVVPKVKQNDAYGQDYCNYQQGGYTGYTGYTGYGDQDYYGMYEPEDCFWGDESQIIWDDEPNALDDCELTAYGECWKCHEGYTYDYSDWSCMPLSDANCTMTDYCSYCIGTKKSSKKQGKAMRDIKKRIQKRTVKKETHHRK